MSDQFEPVINKVNKNSYIYVEGNQNAEKFYIVKEGKVRIIREALSNREGKLLYPGEMFGLISAMASRGYIESALAVSDVTLLVVDRKQYGNLVRSVNSIALNSIKSFSQRLRELDAAFSHRALKSTALEDPSHIFQIAEYYRMSEKIKQALYSYRQYLTHCPNAENKDDVKRKIADMEIQAAADNVTWPEYSPDIMAQSYPKDYLIFVEGERGRNMYIIQNGSVKITKIVDNQEIVLAVLGKGDIFGEMALLEDKPRAATAMVCEDCTLLAVNGENFSNLIKEQPDMVVRLAALMADRIWLLYRQLDNTFIENPIGRIYDALLIQLEKDRININSRNSYQCNFGFKELLGMAGIPETESKLLFRKITGDGKLSFKEDKVLIDTVSDILKETSFYRRAQKMNTERNGIS
jgi:CRP-like cAMP-binding protein